MILTLVIDLSRQHVVDADPKVMQQINFTGNLDQANNNVFHYRRSKIKLN